MSLKSLSLLVLAVLLGTALSVRWYLAADASVVQAREGLRQEPQQTSPYGRHAPIWMRAEPAPRPRNKPAQGVARGGSQRVQDSATRLRGPVGVPVEAVLEGTRPTTTGPGAHAGRWAERGS